jgi:polyphosphate glucokinase
MRNGSRSSRRRMPRGGARTLCIDVGGTGIKAAVVDSAGAMLTEQVRTPTPRPATPDAVLEAIATLAGTLSAADRMSIGFPGVIRDGVVGTAVNLDDAAWRGFDLASGAQARLGLPVRVLNDADVQGLGTVSGRGIECVLTLGTGLGFALFEDGRLLPHLELGQHPIRHGKTYDRYLGAAALKRKGREKWNRRVRRAIDTVRTLVGFDTLYLGGGNAKKVDGDLPADVRIASNRAGITGGVRLWDTALDGHFPPHRDAAAPDGRRGATHPDSLAEAP